MNQAARDIKDNYLVCYFDFNPSIMAAYNENPVHD